MNRLPAGGDEVSSPNNSMASSFQMDFTIFRGGSTGSNAAALARSGNKRDSAAAVAGGNDAVAGERGSDDDENGLNSSRKKLRLSKEQSAYLEESFKEHNTLNPVRFHSFYPQIYYYIIFPFFIWLVLFVAPSILIYFFPLIYFFG